MAIIPKTPRERSNTSRIKAAVRFLKRMPIEDRIQLLVKANLMTQAEADRAKRRVAEAGGSR